MNANPTVLFAPVLPAEGWTSIELQEQNILDALRAQPRPPRIVVVPVADWFARFPVGRQFFRNVVYPRRIRRLAATIGRCVLHVSEASYGHLCAASTPCVVNCNDLQHYVLPELSPGYLRRWKRRVGGMRHARKVVAISAHLAGEVRAYLELPAERIVTLPGGVDFNVFHPFSRAEATARLPEVAALRERHHLVLNIGTNLRRKNLPTLLRALRVLVGDQRRAVKLLKVGPPLLGGEHDALIRSLGVAEAIVDLGHLPAPQVAAACRLAHVLSFPSLYEGFGRPTVEAQACELPCVLADASCLREIGGGGARYHAPEDHAQLAGELAAVIDQTGLREKLIAAGRANVARFSWAAYGESLLAVYREVLA